MKEHLINLDKINEETFAQPRSMKKYLTPLLLARNVICSADQNSILCDILPLI